MPFDFFPSFVQLNIKMGRALRPGEHRVKVYQLCVNDPEVKRNCLSRHSLCGCGREFALMPNSA